MTTIPTEQEWKEFLAYKEKIKKHLKKDIKESEIAIKKDKDIIGKL